MALQKGQRLREAGQFEVAAVGQIKSAGDNARLWARQTGGFVAADA
ncbi:hypothetical protein K9838_14295 [Xanthomonas phaseoli pv. manihotis]|nr:hypothetical protein [Xanthomonas phaseoli]MBO9765209.1 hypothetical protein [Xanthomonas phaseoli pv. manihotis]UEQ13867.1 hypothetical protein K9838_14295 [Xanthomonas phaseoli pv. manihotis]